MFEWYLGESLWFVVKRGWNVRVRTLWTGWTFSCQTSDLVKLNSTVIYFASLLNVADIKKQTNLHWHNEVVTNHCGSLLVSAKYTNNKFRKPMLENSPISYRSSFWGKIRVDFILSAFCSSVTTNQRLDFSPYLWWCF